MNSNQEEIPQSNLVHCNIDFDPSLKNYADKYFES